MEAKRDLKIEEYQLLENMLKELKEYDFNLNELKVVDMLDGGMGSLYIVNALKTREERKMNKAIIEKQFYDVDDVPISVSINIDTDGNLFELDIWRVDFNPIINFPKYP
ncbi:hypothetical protein [Flavivirga sp. 57AJ16]|uniref:DUF6984 family protein n=1 Tax=Flavivirga sp. 57AJ16 TaxID=3025307 RepID=UPI0023670C26|nr:hypothetical protein [Flavivirga sp. 57AJ16]MDD7888279.1 hypothetical protein [Flavivirga sp. 57AJ16]